MDRCELFGYRVEMDVKATRDWYRNADEWGCECGHCRNFLNLARSRKLPVSVMEMLDRLGIPPEKATYVCELYTDDSGIHYQFSYRIAGTIIGAPITDGGENGNEGRCCHEPYPYGAPDFPNPHFDLEFYATLPWVLDETQN